MISLDRAVEAAAIPITGVAPPITSAPQDSEQGLSKESSCLIDHFPPDKNLSYLFSKKYYTSDFHISSSASLPKALPKVSDERKRYLKDFLFKERRLNLKGAKGNIITVNASIAKLLKFCQGENRLVGGFLKYILGSNWFLQIAFLLELPDTDSSYFKKILRSFDSEEIDIDLQHIDPNVEREVLYRKFIQLLATCSTSKKMTDEQQGKVTEDILKGGSFAQVNTFFSVEDEIICDVNRIPLKFEELNSIDLSAGPILKKAYLTSIQDLGLVLDSILKEPEQDLIPRGDTIGGWECILDCLCKTYHFKKLNVLAWARTLVYNTQMGRHPGKIPEEIYEAIRTKCTEEKTVARTLGFIVGLVGKHKPGSETLLLLTYNVCADLYNHGFETEDLRNFCRYMLREEKYSGALGALKNALITLPFDVLSSCVELIGIVKMASKNSSGLFLTQHDGRPCLMTFFGETHTIIQRIDPKQALEKLSKYTFSQETLDIVERLCIELGVKEELKRDFESAIDRYQKQLGWDWEVLALQTIATLNKSKELDSILHKFYSLCTGFSKVPQESSSEIVLDLFRRWTPLDSLSGFKLWDLYTAELSKKELLNVAHAVASKPIHPKLAIHILKDLMDKIIDAQDLHNILRLLSQSPFEKDLENLLAFFRCVSVLKKKSAQLEILCLAFLNKWILDRNSSNLFILAVSEKVLPISQETAELCLSIIEKSCLKEEYDEAFTLWTKGDDLGLWGFPVFQKSHLPFMIKFIEFLYSLNDNQSDSAGHYLLEKLPEVKKDKTLNGQIQVLHAAKNKKLEEIERSLKALEARIASFEKALKEATEHQQAELYKMAEDLIRDLSLVHPVHQVNLSHLNRAKLLLSNPRVIELYRNQSQVYRTHLIHFIERAEKMSRTGRTDRSVVSALFELYLRECSGSPLPQSLLTIFISHLREDKQMGLRNEVLRNLDTFVRELKNHSRIVEVCQMLEWHSAETNATPRLEDCFWVFSEACRAENQSTCLNRVLPFSIEYIDKNPIPKEFETTRQLQCYITVAESYLNNKQCHQALPWIRRAITLVVSADVTSDGELEKKLVAWCKHCSDNEGDIVATFLEHVSNVRHDLNEEVWNTLNELSMNVCVKKPQLYLKLLSVRDIKSIPNSLIPKINRVFQSALIDSSLLEHNLQACLSYYEVNDFFHNLSFEFVLNAVSKIDNCSLKVKALTIQTVRVALIKLGTFMEDREKMIDWARCLLTMIRLIEQLKKAGENLDYATLYSTLHNLLFGVNVNPIRIHKEPIIENSSEQSSTIKKIWEIHELKEIPQVVHEILRSSIEILPTLESQINRYLVVVLGIVEVLESHKGMFHSSAARNAVTMQMLSAFAKSPVNGAFQAGIFSLFDQFELEHPPAMVELTDMLALYLNHVDQFAEDKKIVDGINKLVLEVGAKIPLELHPRLYDSLIKCFPKVPTPGRYLLPTEILKNMSWAYYVHHILKELFLCQPWGFIAMGVVLAFKRGRVDPMDLLYWFIFFVLWDKFLRPRYTNIKSKNYPAGFTLF